MLLSRANLAVLDVAGRDPKDPVLNQVRIEADGSTVASDGAVLMAVSPVTGVPTAFPEFPGVGVAAGVVAAEGGLGLPPEIAAQCRRDMPRGALGLGLGFAAVTLVGAGPTGGVELTTTDLNRHLKVEGRKGRRAFPEWRATLAGARAPAGATGVAHVAVDRKALVRLLHALDSAAPDPENVVFIEIPLVSGEAAGLVVRARNAATGQSVVGLAMSMNTSGRWLELSAWEAGVFNGAVAKKVPVRLHR